MSFEGPIPQSVIDKSFFSIVSDEVTDDTSLVDSELEALAFVRLLESRGYTQSDIREMFGFEGDTEQ